MLRKILSSYNDRFLSRWVVLAFDIFMVGVAFVIATVLRYNFEFHEIDPNDLSQQAIVACMAYFIGFLLTQSYAGIVRHTGVNDAVRLVEGAMIASGGVLFISAYFSWFQPLYSGVFNFSRSIIIIHFLLVLFFLIGSRFFVKGIYITAVKRARMNNRNIVIFGAGTSGMITRNALLSDPISNVNVVAFMDENPSKVRKSLEGIPVLHPDKVLKIKFIEQKEISEVVISIQGLSRAKLREISDKAVRLGLQVKIVPPAEKWINGELSARQLRQVRIEDLLERDPIQLDNFNIEREIKDRVILVTGAAGSIGSEIARQVLHYSPKKVIYLDQAESPLYELEFEIKSKFPDLFNRCQFVVASVKDFLRMEKLFETHKPEVIYHAAAYKHVPLMEANPYEALMVNVFGTKIMADLACEYGAQKFVMVSTDKAVNPTNVMGTTKRIAEIYAQALANSGTCRTQFITTRFGNVLGSNGSVIPLFRKQIEQGGPITVTHKDITRFFMTIPEACNLVMEAGAMGEGGEIFVFDMGESVKIYDLAKKMIALSGLRLGKDIEIKETGLRPGEKLYEELLANNENTLPTHNAKILKARVQKNDFDVVRRQIDKLSEALVDADPMTLVSVMKEMVPEFISNNSVYEQLDNKSAND
ncbi:MAG: polysaccharide biosynthesis protein [Bacteroidetes bacterium]|uniref:Polysaccharide biosynthesis protein n=1 Tax=Phaeocystidibacter marisrubri TaxID=1577780 RepID=A0A6L3ZJ85_9FLAO|nr:nucleoside-diphosphate sugar epimerase/dehydratase [Phaeocystidibacter marisrubri]KAB2817618.1 polysaccharide biosynthesis protein [Phaeocystidibacter marisrubri]TNE31069.1 MAG: polysaccharide biosynthesis protein [Bacteroidota bacterium]GGH74457.1 polysaccharide biosynthesis protein CapD [Phaeocystidibacter marisrubri]